MPTGDHIMKKVIRREFICDINTIFCVRGMTDIRELYKSAKYYKQDINVLPERYINIQPHVHYVKYLFHQMAYK